MGKHHVFRSEDDETKKATMTCRDEQLMTSTALRELIALRDALFGTETLLKTTSYYKPRTAARTTTRRGRKRKNTRNLREIFPY